MNDYYKTLGVENTATKEQIKKAYRKLSLQFHPDRPNGNAEKFKQINEAYETLNDEQKKRMYDMRNRMPNFNGMKNPNEMPGMQHPDEFFKMFFGNFPGGNFHMGHPNPNIPRANINIRRMMIPASIHKKITLSVEDAFKGINYPLEIERDVYENDGRIRKEKEKIYIDIPSGIDTNEMIIIKGKGNCNQMNVFGDIKINVFVENNSVFVRQGLNLFYIKDISLKEALVGFDIEFKHLNGKNYNMNHSGKGVINPSSQLVMDGMGMKRGEHTGALIIKFKIEFPKQLSNEQKTKLLEIL
tara:strand:- start:786 stop:1682 length:897 start_codon:yes stop_codon:yes gene_type:complete